MGFPAVRVVRAGQLREKRETTSFVLGGSVS